MYKSAHNARCAPGAGAGSWARDFTWGKKRRSEPGVSNNVVERGMTFGNALTWGEGQGIVLED